MNESESQSGMTPDAGIEELQGELRTLRGMIAIALLLLIGLSFCADYFLTKQIESQTAQAAQFQMIADNFPHAAASDFVKRLQDYAKTHPDFASIKAKYPGLFSQPLPPPKK